MNKTNIKNFAIWARNKLRSEIAYKAGLLGISEKGIAEPFNFCDRNTYENTHDDKDGY